jgi:uncharacterized membrane protein
MMLQMTRDTQALASQDIARLALAAIYLGIGAIHIAKPDIFLSAMSRRVPRPKQVIVATGICEIAGAIGLFTPEFRRAAGWALALYAICVFPVNIKHARDKLPVGGVRLRLSALRGVGV